MASRQPPHAAAPQTGCGAFTPEGGGGSRPSALGHSLMHTLHLPMLSLCCQASVSVEAELLLAAALASASTLVSQKL